MNIQLSPEKQGFKDFDLPTEHLHEARHYVSPKTYDVQEVHRRRELSPGTLLAENQRKGLVVARTILENVTEQEGLLFAASTLAMAGINTAWYSYAQNSDVMRRRLKLPIMAHPRARAPGTIIDDAGEALAKQVVRADQLIVATDLRLRSQPEHQRKLGVGVGNVSLRLAMYQPVLEGVFYAVNDNETLAQNITRRRCMKVLEDARMMHTTTGSHPSIAQLSDPYSYLSVYWHRHAPGSAQMAVIDALSD